MLSLLLLSLLLATCSAAPAANNQHRHVPAVAPVEPAVLTSDVLTPFEMLGNKPYTVEYDERAITINHQRVLLLSGSIHYPRSSPSMWPQMMADARAAGLNTIQTYLFWNEHEPVRGQEWDWTTESRNLGQFITAAKDAGLFVNLRIGPYVCAEWFFGGLPLWLRNDPAIQLRYYDDLWLTPVEAMFRTVAEYVEPYLPRNGGNLILAQIENEYGAGGSDPKRVAYINWCADLTQKLAMEIPWIMCQQPDAPKPTIYACNGFYCDGYVDAQQSKGMPALWTENWPGWFMDWGQARVRRPVEDVAFALTKYIAAGGGLHNYYMYQGGTNWGLNQGGPGIIQSYDYDAPVDEYGVPHSPKYDHLAENHKILNSYARTLLSQPHAKPTTLAPNVLLYAYNSTSAPGVFFVANSGTSSSADVTLGGVKFTIPKWSVTIIDATSLTVMFNTQTFSPSTIAAAARYEATIKAPLMTATPSKISQLDEPVGIWAGATVITAQPPLEQLTFTQYTSTYLRYYTQVELSQNQISTGKVTLTLSNTGDYFYCFIDSKFLLASNGVGNDANFSLDVSSFSAGKHTLLIVVDLLGVTNGASSDYTENKGIQGNVTVDGVKLIAQPWQHVTGLWGEQNKVFALGAHVPWAPYNGTTTAWTWYEVQIPTLAVNNPLTATYYLKMDSIVKGHVYVNGFLVGPFWNVRAPETGCKTCDDYAGNYDPANCRTNCGEPTQAQYHVPRDALNLAPDGIQRVVVFSEQGGNVAGISLNQRN